MSAQGQKIAFVDRDGCVLREPGSDHHTPYQITSLDEMVLLPRVISGLAALADAGFTLVMITNQDGLGTNANPRETFDRINAKLNEILHSEGLAFSEILVCPHRPEDDCACRKPKTGLVGTLDFDVKTSVVIGDRDSDLALARALGLKGYRITDYADWLACARQILADAGQRCASIRRETRETRITLSLGLDGTGRYDGQTGNGFLDHMLELWSKHGLFDLSLSARGDTQVDDHHLVEDIGICLGQAIRQAAGDKRGARRYGQAILPMDEVLVCCAVDLSGRFAFESNYQPQRTQVGALSTEMVRHFFESLSHQAGLNLHLHLLSPGRNEHHRIEAMFKAFARALRQAVALDSRAPGDIASSKGVL